MKKFTLIFLTVWALALIWPAQAPATEELARLSTISKPQLEIFNKIWRDSPNMGLHLVSDATGKLAGEFQKLHKEKGAGGVAERLVSVYETDAASAEMTAAGLAFLFQNGYSQKGSTLGKGSFGAGKEDPDALVASVNAVVDAILASKAPRARMIAVEFILQVLGEGLETLHNASGNGFRKPMDMPPALAARAAEFLNDEEPFVRAMADWAVSIHVCNANDNSRARAYPLNNPNAPDWLKAYLAVDVKNHLPYDHVRQAITLGMHRRPADLTALGKDVARRALERAAWAKPRMAATEIAELDKAIENMRGALTNLEQSAAKSSSVVPEVQATWTQFRQSVREIVLRGPDVNFNSIAYIKRFGFQIHLQPSSSGPGFPDGGDLYVQDGFHPAAEPRALLGGQLGPGSSQDMDLHWDGDRVVFSWKKGKLQKLFEIGLDGKNLRPVTDGPFDDVNPTYLPDDEVVFASTRGEVGITCAGALGLVGPNGEGSVFSGFQNNIFRTRKGWTEVERLTYSKDDDAYPSVLNDGRVVWMRWDYQERGVNEIFSLWVINPDGTGSDGYHRVHIPAKETIQALRDSRAIEDSAMMISAGAGHYNYAEGTLILGDPSMGINNPAGLRNITPHVSPVLFGWGNLAPVNEGGVPYLGGYYSKPWPLSEKSFLASASHNQPLSCNFQAYFVDVWGNKELLHRDKLLGTERVIPIRPRKRPPVLPDRTKPELTHATLYVYDVYNDLPGVAKGEVKYIRVLQMAHWLRERGQQGIQWHPKSNPFESFGFGTCGPVRVVGTAPVAADGSAFFEVPSDMDVYFQALDENFMAVQRMRTAVEFKPGENRGCVGCHETRDAATLARHMGLAAKTEAVRPTPPPWGDSTFIDYEKMIQPIFDKKCVECHGGKSGQGWLNLSDARDEHGFMQGYRSLYGLKLGETAPKVSWTPMGEIDPKTKTPNDLSHPWFKIMMDSVIVRDDGTGGRVTEVRQFGAVKHPLAQKLVKDAEHAKLLTADEKQLMMTFFDVQVPYFSTYRQTKGKELIPVRVEPFAPFGKSREYTIHHGIPAWPISRDGVSMLKPEGDSSAF